MKRRWWVGILIALAAGSVAAAAPPAPAPTPGKAPAVRALRVKKAVLGIRHRAIAQFYEENAVTVGEAFSVGDTKYTAKILRFVPDFQIDMKTHQVFSKSEKPENPALQIATWEDGTPHDTSWAFLNFPPHFSKKALLAFQVLKIEFENHAPVTAAAAKPQPTAPEKKTP